MKNQTAKEAAAAGANATPKTLVKIRSAADPPAYAQKFIASVPVVLGSCWQVLKRQNSLPLVRKNTVAIITIPKLPNTTQLRKFNENPEPPGPERLNETAGGSVLLDLVSICPVELGTIGGLFGVDGTISEGCCGSLELAVI